MVLHIIPFEIASQSYRHATMAIAGALAAIIFTLLVVILA